MHKIRQELNQIRYYYSRRELFDKAFGCVGKSGIVDLVEKYNIEKDKATIDVGVRVEVPSHIMDPLEDFYEAKIVCKGRYGDEARMFCYNRLRAHCVNEKYDVDGEALVTVNGHAYSSDDKISNTDNFAILVKTKYRLYNIVNFVVDIIALPITNSAIETSFLLPINLIANSTFISFIPICSPYRDIVVYTISYEFSIFFNVFN